MSPRLGVVRRLSGGASIHASGFRAFRTPTMNELYRTGQVGQQPTLANGALLSERATGAEGGADWASHSRAFAAQGTYFWTSINRPVSAVLVSSTPTTITNLRENLGQIESQGGSSWQHRWYPRAHSPPISVTCTRTRSSSPSACIGRPLVPEVPRHSATAQLHYRPTPAVTITAAAREIGHAFDDSSNIYKLHGFFVLDAYAESWIARLTPQLSFYASLQNILDRSIETARSPYVTLGTPSTAVGGVRLRLGGRGLEM